MKEAMRMGKNGKEISKEDEDHTLHLIIIPVSMSHLSSSTTSFATRSTLATPSFEFVVFGYPAKNTIIAQVEIRKERGSVRSGL